ncbi:acyltransferase [Nostoc sp. NIES-2111]
MGSMTLNDRVHINGRGGTKLKTSTSGRIRIDARTFLNSGVQIYSAAEVRIGPFSRIGDGCIIIDSNFHAVHEGQSAASRPINIGRNVWLGRGVIVLPGVTIGDHSVVAAGSVVFNDIPAKQVWRGNPARFWKNVRASDEFRRC